VERDIQDLLGKDDIIMDFHAATLGWRSWWDAIEVGASDVNQVLAEAVQVKEGDHILDITTGIGEAAAELARAVGPKGSVTANKIAPRVCGMARSRPINFELEQMGFCDEEEEALDFAEGSFDSVICRWGLMFFPETKNSLEHIKSVLKPGGRFAAVVWGQPDSVPMISVPFRVVSRQLQAPPSSILELGSFSLSDSKELEILLYAAGFEEVYSETKKLTLSWDSVNSFLRFLTECAPYIGRMIDEVAPENRKKIIWHLKDAISDYADFDGQIRMNNSAICVSARLPK
jgi:ubiquinone/menaquinone biosynthesis C-methylase UbiE